MANFRKEFKSSSRVFHSNAREGKQLQQQLSFINRATVRNVKNMQVEIDSMRKELLANQRILGTRMDVQRGYLVREAEGKKEIQGRTIDCFTGGKVGILHHQMQRRHSLAAIGEAELIQNRVRNDTSRTTTAQRKSYDDLYGLEAKTPNNRWALLSLGHSPNQLHRRKSLTANPTGSSICGKPCKESPTPPFYALQRRRHSLATCSIEPNRITNVNQNDIHSRPQNPFSDTNGIKDTAFRFPISSGVCRQSTEDFRVRPRRHSLPNTQLVQNYTKLSFGEQQPRKLTAKLPVSEYKAHSRNFSMSQKIERPSIQDTSRVSYGKRPTPVT